MKTLLSILVLSVALTAQVKDFTIVSSADQSILPVMVNVSYTLPSDDPLVQAAEHDAMMKPTTIVYYWGDEESGAKTRSYTQTKYGESVRHSYKKTGTFGIMVSVTDAKNRLIRQAAIQIKIQQPFEVVMP